MKNKFIKFMTGRHGIDDIYKDGLILAMILLILDMFINSRILRLLQSALILTLLYRSFSKNIYKRTKENNKYLKLKKKILKPIKEIKKHFKDEYHIYRKCHHCSTNIPKEKCTIMTPVFTVGVSLSPPWAMMRMSAMVTIPTPMTSGHYMTRNSCLMRMPFGRIFSGMAPSLTTSSPVRPT